jgi:hypothetical protein
VARNVRAVALAARRPQVPEMKKAVAAWAMRRAAADDYSAARDAHNRGTLQTRWPNIDELRAWSKRRGWPTPWFCFDSAVLAKLFENPTNFACALEESGIEFDIPRQEYTLSLESLRELDELYEERSPSGHPVWWRLLVEELREIRRAVEVGVVVQVEGGPVIRTPRRFLQWVDERYHMLEEGVDAWVGDDR